MRNRSNLLVLLGIAFFVVGGIIVYVLTNDDGGGGGGGGSTADAPVTVVVATHDIGAGTKADDAIKLGDLKEKKVPAGILVSGAVRSLAQLQGATIIQAFAADDQITGTGVQLVKRGYDLPEGYEAIAVNLNFVPGVAGYVNPGDRINLYGAFQQVNTTTGETIPNTDSANLVLTDVRVLDVSQTIPANGTTPDTTASGATNRTIGDQTVFLLAVKTADAEKIVYMMQKNSIYASLVRDDAAPSQRPGGADAKTILTGDPASSAG